MEKYSVTASSLNLRSTPSKIDNLNIIAKIPFQNIVELINKTTTDWWQIQIIESNIKGFVFSRYLVPFVDDQIKISGIKEVNFQPDSKASLNSKQMMFKPIGDSSIPFRDLTSIESKIDSIKQIINKLNVASSIRYQKTEKNTFCNIYAYDFCYFCKTYLPRIWWNENSLKKILSGEALDIIYEKTVSELNANALHDWLLNWGDDFGWERIFSVNDFQNKVNTNGGVGIICAKRKDTKKSGHIVAVVPENNINKAFRQNGEVIYPLQSQAGSLNYNYFSEIKKDWWNGNQFKSYVFFYHQ